MITQGIRNQLIERGKKFVALQGMNFRLQKGIAYMKHKNNIIRFIINGRVMVDPAIFRHLKCNHADLSRATRSMNSKVI